MLVNCYCRKKWEKESLLTQNFRQCRSSYFHPIAMGIENQEAMTLPQGLRSTETWGHRVHSVFFRTDRYWSQTSFIWSLIYYSFTGTDRHSGFTGTSRHKGHVFSTGSDRHSGHSACKNVVVINCSSILMSRGKKSKNLGKKWTIVIIRLHNYVRMHVTLLQHECCKNMGKCTKKTDLKWERVVVQLTVQKEIL